MAYEEITVYSIGELLENIEKMIKEENTRIWFRGHVCESYKLVPSVMRKEFIDYQECEDNFTSRFYDKAKIRIGKHIDKNDYASWLSVMQHYALPTRLLDWSGSPLVAAYFAVHNCREVPENDPQRNACIWALRPRVLNAEQEGFDRIIYPLDSPKVKTLLEKAFMRNCNRSGQIIACWAVMDDPRVIMQQSAFTVHDTDVPLEDSASGGLLKKFVIPFSCQESILYRLEICGIRTSYLFPDMENISRQIKYEHKHKIEY